MWVLAGLRMSDGTTGPRWDPVLDFLSLETKRSTNHHGTGNRSPTTLLS